MSPRPAAERGPYVVGIGASSGALPALQVLLSSLPLEPGFACVIVVHLSPEHESHMAQLLQPHSRMPVQQVTTTTALEPNRVYVIPPNANLDTIDTHLRLTRLEERRIERAPIDHFLRTLAATHDGTAIGVILTGAGSDGSIGLRRIKECGGLAIAQDPQEAAYDSMPRSAIATGMVDLILPLSRIADEILQFCQTQPQLPLPGANDAIDVRDAAFVRQVLHELQNRADHDFNVYRAATLLRHLRRRMQLHHVVLFGAYLEILSHQPQEVEALTNDLVLTPTEFFRDSAVFLELERHIIPQIFARKNADRDRVRIWSIGCSTGEEAYSLAMLLLEERAHRGSHAQLQVFASDRSEKVLTVARDGLYPPEIATSVSSERLERFFTQQPGFYRVKRELRDTVLFASHNLFKDPPFGHIDLIVCQSLLSDLQPEVRLGLLHLFHYALEPEGVLLVGSDEDVNEPQLFAPLAQSARLLRKLGAREQLPALPSSMQPFGPAGIRGSFRIEPPAMSDIAVLHRSAMEPYALASVLIDSDNNVAHLSSNAARYLYIPGGELTQDLTQLVREPIRASLLEGLRSVGERKRTWKSEPLSVPTEAGWCRLVLRVERVATTKLILVIFDDRESSSLWPPGDALNTFTTLQTGLEHLGARLQGLFDTAQEGSARPRAEMQEASTELQAVLEELATSREELQAVNEELLLLDDENRRRLQELTQISNDLEHLLAATGIATLFLDEQLRIVRFTPAFGELLGLRATDVGRPVSDLTRLGLYAEFETD
ncbi:MAG: PAS domain-containing protein, partial [Sinobacteraceae bacterium]|nr:PAS domain-containing protein [Nevskiaceae bacterium]